MGTHSFIFFQRPAAYGGVSARSPSADARKRHLTRAVYDSYNHLRQCGCRDGACTATSRDGEVHSAMV